MPPLAPGKEGINPFPFRYFGREQAQALLSDQEALSPMQESPGNRGGYGRLPRSDAEALSMINAVAPQAQQGKPLTADQIYIHYMEAANDNFIGDRWMFLGESTLKNIARDAQAGFAFMNSHRTGGYYKPAELPFGRTFCGRYEEVDGRGRTVIGIYMLRGVRPNGDQGPSTDDLSQMIDAGTVFDCSVGLWGGQDICSVCGNDMWEYIFYDEETDTGGHWACPHVPGTHYRMTDAQKAAQEALGVPGGNCTYTLEEATCSETSAVYDGAVPNAGFRKGYTLFREGALDEETFEAFLASHPRHLPFINHPAAEKLRGGNLPGATWPNGNLTLAQGENPMDPKPDTQNKPNPATALGTAIINALTSRLGLGRGNATAETDDATILNLLSPTAPSAPVAPAPVAQPDPGLTAQLAATNEQLQKLQADLAAEKKANFENGAKAWIEEQKRLFKITPAQGDTLLELAKESPAAFEAVKPTIEANVPSTALSGDTIPSTELGGGADGETIRTQLERKAQEFAAASKVSYTEAFRQVCSDNPELARQYREAQAAPTG